MKFASFLHKEQKVAIDMVSGRHLSMDDTNERGDAVSSLRPCFWKAIRDDTKMHNY